MTDEARESLRPNEVAQLDPYKRRRKTVVSEAEELLPITLVEAPKIEQRVRRPLTKEEKEALAREGLTAAYSLTGETILDQKGNGRRFWEMVPSENDILVTTPSITGDVVVDPGPDKFFLPRSNNSTLAEQLEMIAEYSHNLQRRLGTDSIEAIMGEVPDYTALAFAHLYATGERFFGQKYGFKYTRTKTSTVGSLVADVGHFDPDNGLGVYGRGADDRYDFIFAAPLVVATSGVK